VSEGRVMTGSEYFQAYKAEALATLARVADNAPEAPSEALAQLFDDTIATMEQLDNLACVPVDGLKNLALSRVRDELLRARLRAQGRLVCVGSDGCERPASPVALDTATVNLCDECAEHWRDNLRRFNPECDEDTTPPTGAQMALEMSE
jgi:predicted exporter